MVDPRTRPWGPPALAVIVTSACMLHAGCASGAAGSPLTRTACELNPACRSIPRRLQSEDPADRVQAAIDAARWHSRQAVPLLVERLSDSEATVRFAAIQALRRITGTDCGYRYFCDEPARSAAVARWRVWLDREFPPPASAPADRPAEAGSARPPGTGGAT